MKKNGVTLVELLVAMAIFLIIITIVVGAFASVSRMKALTSTMKEAQQKTRITLEMITRLSRQAEKVVVSSDGKDLELYFNINGGTENIIGAQFRISGDELLYSECSGSLKCTEESSWGQENNLYEGVILGSESKFTKIGKIPPSLSVELYGNIGDSTNTYFSDELNINTSVILERIK